MPVIYINIGSNRGDRMAFIEKAVALIASEWSGAAVRRAPVMESEPWGYVSGNPFLNLGIALDVEDEVDPFDVLDRLQAIERSISVAPHRNADGSYRDRDIDIDLIEIDGITVDSPRLILPHPRMKERPFVMIPLQYLKNK